MGERNALKHVSGSRKESLTPLLEIQPPNDKTLDEHLLNFERQIKECWGKSEPIFVDIDHIYSSDIVSEETMLQSGEHPVEYIAKAVENAGTKCIPVFSFIRYNINQTYNDALKKVNETYSRGICLRITAEELVDLNDLKTSLDIFLEEFYLNQQSVDIILDFQDISTQNEQQLHNELVRVLLHFPYILKWRTLTFCSTSFPVQLSKKVATKSNGTLPRTEWKVYKQLSSLNIARIPSFGDYTVVNPQTTTDFDPSYMDMAPTIKYTITEEFLIFRGSGVKASGKGFAQTHTLAQDVVAHSEYLGKTFSHGDEFIHERATNSSSSKGNATSWVTVNVNHHLELVASHFSSSHVVSNVN